VDFFLCSWRRTGRPSVSPNVAQCALHGARDDAMSPQESSFLSGRVVPLGPDVAPPAGVSDVAIKAIQCADYTLETRQVRKWRWLMPRQGCRRERSNAVQTRPASRSATSERCRQPALSALSPELPRRTNSARAPTTQRPGKLFRRWPGNHRAAD